MNDQNVYLYIYEPPNTRAPTHIVNLCTYDKWLRMSKTEQDALIKKITVEYPNHTNCVIRAE
ncbi:hypothetical protein TCT1_26690 [Xenorhabdus sp. TCT-1]|uniref:Uncharacterized protein n=1 Tax=Xenorhabdus taiwanensis TaxID=3085177 RepID=A0ABM8JXC6_9GAMM|nr:hypothetical protein TCT1_14060 [Xenorhabdus sp. TCT-1]BET97339.1 hypothetical protein TCT1_22600 [Xenorhabdus sp. TCT-1]BET97748.1 hypothetical protein TCT1_26690 [Xenorhabdus sp. TCT-1]